MLGRGTGADTAAGSSRLLGRRKSRRRFRAHIRLVASCGALALSLLLVTQAGARVETSRAKAKSSAPRVVTNAYRVTGAIPGDLAVGVRKRIKIKLANRQSYGLWVYRLRIKGRVDDAHRAAGCSMSRDFRIQQLPRRTFPFSIPKKKTRTIEQNVGGEIRRTKTLATWTLPPSRSFNLPAIELRNLSRTNQDACKGAVVNLEVDSRAEKEKDVADSRLKKEKF